MSKQDEILQKIKTILTDACDAPVEFADALPDEIPESGMILISEEFDPGEPDQVLGGPEGSYYEVQIPVSIVAQHPQPATRRTIVEGLLAQADAALQMFPDFDGLAEGVTYGAPAINNNHTSGTVPIREAILTLTVAYQTDDTPIT